MNEKSLVHDFHEFSKNHKKYKRTSHMQPHREPKVVVLPMGERGKMHRRLLLIVTRAARAQRKVD